MKNYKVDNYYLDNYQMELLTNDENTIVIAGAGSGKTLTIIGKINYIIENNLAKEDEVLVISFTNASVNDLRKRISYDVQIVTFHKLGMFILDKAKIAYSLCPQNYLQYIVDEELQTCQEETQKNILKFLKYKDDYEHFLNSKEFISFSKLIVTFINLWQTNNYKYQDINWQKYNKLEKKIVLFIFKIYRIYISEKKSNEYFDFDDLIIKSKNYISSIGLNYKYIIIDEFQDTSFIRLNLVQEIVKHTKAKIIVVGDDWQSIYQFSGCNLEIFINFSQYFDHVRMIKLANTYRNSQELIDIASAFIQKNSLQLKKELYSNKSNKSPLIFVPYKNARKKFQELLDFLIKKTTDIMIISRNNKDIYDYLNDEMQYDDNYLKYKNIQIPFLTIHRSKGLEAKYIIVLNCNDSILGIPNKIENHPIINNLYSYNEMKYGEERRLFYVAITRCKESTYLLYNKNSPSIFINEIQKNIKEMAFF